MELAVLPVVDFEGDDCSCLERENPEAVRVQGAAHEEVHLICRVPCFGRGAVRQLELIVRATLAVGMLLQRGLDLEAQKPFPLVDD